MEPWTSQPGADTEHGPIGTGHLGAQAAKQQAKAELGQTNEHGESFLELADGLHFRPC